MNKYFDTTPHELISDFRLRRVKQLLEETDLPIQEIAPLAGFAYVEHLNLFFKQRAGDSPGRYREQKRLASIRVLRP